MTTHLTYKPFENLADLLYQATRDDAEKRRTEAVEALQRKPCDIFTFQG